MKRFLLGGALLLLVLGSAGAALAETVPTRAGLGLNLGQGYDPGNEIRFVQVNGFVLFDYDRIWPHPAPEPLRFKVEANLGATISPQVRTLAAVNMLALYYLDPLRVAAFRPYFEAGIGLIYNDFRVRGMAWRFNFNPQLGLGAEIATDGAGTWLAALRLHHISNGGLNGDNRGNNSVLLQIGRYF